MKIDLTGGLSVEAQHLCEYWFHLRENFKGSAVGSCVRGEAEVAVVIINPALSFNRAGSSRESPEISFSQTTFKFSPPCFTCEVNTSGPFTFDWAQNDSVQFIKEG